MAGISECAPEPSVYIEIDGAHPVDLWISLALALGQHWQQAQHIPSVPEYPAMKSLVSLDFWWSVTHMFQYLQKPVSL